MKNKMFDETSKLTRKRLLTIVVGAALVLAALVYVYSTGSLKNTAWTGTGSDGKGIELTFHTRDQATIKRFEKNSKIRYTTAYYKYDLNNPIITLTRGKHVINCIMEDGGIKLTDGFGHSSMLRRK